MTATAKPTEWHCPDWPARLVGSLLSGLAVVILFRELLAGCLARWISEPQYSHGFLVPFVALLLGWSRREKFLHGTARSSPVGLALILAGIAGHFVADYFFAEAIDAICFLLTLVGVTLLIWGRRAFSGLWPAVLFTGFMLPLPPQLERALATPIQVLGANEATWYIQTLGIPAISQGHTILLGDTRLSVVEACSGLRMVLGFFAISTAAVIISKRTAWEKLLMLMSAPPIALICNVARIVASAMAHQSYGSEAASPIFHDFSGWLMIPVGVLLLFLELKLLDCLFVPAGDSRPGMTYHSAIKPFSVQT